MTWKRPGNREYSVLPGFAPELAKHSIFSTPVKDYHWIDSVFQNEVADGKVEPVEVKDAKEIYQCKQFGKIFTDGKQKAGNKVIGAQKIQPDTVGPAKDCHPLFINCL